MEAIYDVEFFLTYKVPGLTLADVKDMTAVDEQAMIKRLTKQLQHEADLIRKR